MANDDQVMELEALQSIYMTEYVPNSATSFKIVLVPEQGAGESTNKVAVDFIVTFPKEYPHAVPVFSVETLKREYLSPEECVKYSGGPLMEVAKENIGTPMVYTMCAAIVEWLQKRNDEIRQSEKTANELEAERREAERKEKARKQVEASIYGTPVTAENFRAWSKKYEAENSQKILAKEEMEKLKRSTGRQLFEQNAKMFDVALDENAVDVEIDKSKLLSNDEVDNDGNTNINWNVFDDDDGGDDDDDDDANDGDNKDNNG